MANATISQPQASPENDEYTFCCNPLQCRCGRHWFPQRIVLAVLLHLCLQHNFSIRVALNVAIVEMVAPTEDEINNTNAACPQYAVPERTHQGSSFPWPRQTTSLVLYAFYIGFIFTQVPGGWLADKFGARPVITTCIGLSIVSTTLFPWMTHKFGYLAAVGLRFILGVAHGPCTPSISSMVGIWYPPKERSTWGGVVFAGPILGTILGNIVTGVLIQAFDGWPIAFYFWSAYSVFYFIILLLFLFSYPETHPFISNKEKQLLQESRVDRVALRRTLKTPWKQILCNMPYWANVAAQFGHHYIFFILITYLPTYLRDILRFDVSSDGLFASIPFIVLWITSLLLSAASRYMISCISQKAFDKFLGAGSNVVSAVLVLAAMYAGCHRTLCITLHIISMIAKAFFYVSVPMNINALSKNYGGVMFGMCKAICALSGIIGNFIVGYITKEKTLWEWQLSFWITLGIQLATTIFYFIFSSTERQAFDYQAFELHQTT